MEKIRDSFVRVKEGEWFCRAPCAMEGFGTDVRFTPGVVYRKGRPHMGVDVAAILEDWMAIGELPPDVCFR